MCLYVFMNVFVCSLYVVDVCCRFVFTGIDKIHCLLGSLIQVGFFEASCQEGVTECCGF
jgi:hypothetical protein